MVEATTGFRLDPTSILDVYKVFWHLDMLPIAIWGHPYSDTHVQVRGGFWGFGVLSFGGRPEPVWCCNVIVEATTGIRLNPISILDVHKVFWDLDMLSIGIWGHSYSDMPLQVGGGFLSIWVHPYFTITVQAIIHEQWQWVLQWQWKAPPPPPSPLPPSASPLLPHSLSPFSTLSLS